MNKNWDIEGVPSNIIFGDYFPNIGYEDERWKKASLPDLYVSDCGRFYDAKNKRFVKPTHGDREGHKSIKITKNGVHMQKYAHRIIAEAFIPNPDKLPIVRHLDDEPENNCLDNLAWGTQSDNVRDAMKNGKSHFVSPEEREKGIDPMRKPVKAIREHDGKELYFRSVIESAKGTGAQQANVSKVLCGLRPRTVGHRYEYISKEEYNEKRSN